MYEIETTHALPGSHLKTPTRMALEALTKAPVGASFYIPEGEDNTGNVQSKAKAVGGGGWVSVRKMPEGGIRVWKVAEPR